MLDWRSLISLSDAELARLDIAAVNLACAQGLPGAERIEVNRCLATIDYWTGIVKKWTDAAYQEFFLMNPGEYDHSEPCFRIMAIVTALQRHCGVKYNSAKIALTSDAPFDFDDDFIHGVIQGPGGTCATMPVVYAAVGRRLGYPIRLVCTRQHLFCRWDDPQAGVYLNIEGTGKGVSLYSDDHYRTWPLPITREQEVRNGYLKSMTPRQELASFIAHRGFRWHDVGKYRHAVESFVIASVLDAGYAKYSKCVLEAMDKWRQHLQSQYPPLFPRRIEVLLSKDRRRWPEIPWELEREIAALHATEYCLHDPENVQMWWEPLRKGQPPLGRAPTGLTVNYEAILQESQQGE